MTRLEKRIIWIIGIAVLVLTALLRLNYWWANIPPKRPASVPATAGYCGGLATTFPGSKRGEWVNCWFDSEQNADRCRVTFVNGRLLYEGVYLPYQRQTPIPQGELLIDSMTMNRAQEQVEVDASSGESSEPGLQVVPLVYLRNGEVLIPAKAYEVGKKRLDQIREARGLNAKP